jgi:serine phosphatase RsbU (regulator of sigma subunit)/tetratricopeptide (TPR) repeat protein
MKQLLLIVTVFLMHVSTCVEVRAQNSVTDSLLANLKKTGQDTFRVNALHDLSRNFLPTDQMLAINYCRQAVNLSRTLSFKRGEARSLQNIGVAYYYSDNYDSALYYFKESLKIKEESGDKKGMASSYNNIGAIQTGHGEDSEGLKNYIKALMIYEELGDADGATAACLNIGNVLAEQYDHVGAMKYYRLALKYAQRSGNEESIADAYHNIGSSHNDSEKRDSAMFYYKKALAMYLEQANNERVASVYGMMGEWYFDAGSNDSAEFYLMKSYELNRETENSEGIAMVLQFLGRLKLTQGRMNEAENYLLEGLAVASELGLREYESNYYRWLAEYYAANKDHSNAFKFSVRYASLKDSLINEEGVRQITEMKERYESEAKQREIEILQKDNALRESELQQQNIMLWAIGGGLVLALLLVFSITRSLRTAKKQNEIIEAQKLVVEEKNTNIIDSINYAKRIQLALLNKTESENTGNIPEHFVLYHPKDIVSGDFYWNIQIDRYWYIAAADCTGHGVPGAFLSMLGVAFLNEIAAGRNELKPAEVLEQLRKRIVEELSRDAKDEFGKDGMDISLGRFDTGTNVLEWSGANIPLYIVRNDEVLETDADSQPVGYQREMKPFSNHQVQLQSGDCVYFFTDGIIDQFGGERGKKFSYARFRSLILAGQNTTMSEMKAHIGKELSLWRGNYDQTDDICVIGVKID